MSDQAAEVVIGLDLGTSGIKAVALRADGSIAARARAGYPTHRDVQGAAEQSPGDWRAAAFASLRRLAAEVAPNRWAAIGLSGMIPTLVLVDADGEPVGPAITWEDARAEPQGERLRDLVGRQTLLERTGHWTDGRYLLPMVMRIREEEPARVDAAVGIRSAKDYLFCLLTGQTATDPSTAVGFGCFDVNTGDWDPETLAAAGLAASQTDLPEVRSSMTTSPMAVQLARALGLPAGLPVCLGAADSALAARGVGATEPGDIAYIAGTSSVILGVSEHPRSDPGHRYLLTPMVEPDRWGLEMDLVSTGSSVEWLARLLGIRERDESRVWELAGGSELGAHGVTFLPYLGFGEQGALWDPALRGAITGLTLARSRADLARALLEGIVLESRRCLEVLEAAGLSGEPIHVTGRGAVDAVFRRALADATGRIVERPGGFDLPASAWGAASLAWAAIGTVAPSRPDADQEQQVVPETEQYAIWQETWLRHERMRAALVPGLEGA